MAQAGATSPKMFEANIFGDFKADLLVLRPGGG
jgi:hypothetical protein